MFRQLDSDLVADAPMRSHLVIKLAQSLQLFLRIGKAREPMRVQAPRAQSAVKRLDERVIGGLSGSGEVQCDAALVGPQIQIASPGWST